MTDERSRPAGAPATGVDDLVERLVPGLAERLRGTVDEIEIARDGWRIRVRRSPSVVMVAPAVPVAHHAASNGSGPAPATGGVPDHAAHLPHLPRAASAHPPARGGGAPGRFVATAPAVGVFMPRGDVSLGAHVRAGDRLGIVDLLGVPQDVVSPADGVYTAALVEAGEGVEYGQELLVIEARS